MKKFIIAAVLCAAVLSFASCSEKKEESQVSADTSVTDVTEPETETEFHERHDYEDGILLGRWHGYDADIAFQEDGNVSAYFDMSDIMLFNSDGTFMFDGTEYSKDTVEYDGTHLKVTIDDEGDKVELLSLERLDDADADSFDGEYSISSDIVKSLLAGAVSDEDYEELDIRMLIKYGKCHLIVKDYAKYEQNGDNLTFDGKSVIVGGFSYDMSECTFVYEDNILVIYNSQGVFEAYTRVNENADESEEETTEASSEEAAEEFAEETSQSE